MNYRVGMMALALALAAAFTGNVQAVGYSFSFSIPHKNISRWPGALLVGEVDPARDNRDNLQFTISGVVDITDSKMRKVGNRFLYEYVDIKESFLNEEYVPNKYYAELWLSEENGEKKFSTLQIKYDFGKEDKLLVVTLSRSLSSPDLELTVRASKDFILACSECLASLSDVNPRRAYRLILSDVLLGFFIDTKSFHWQAECFCHPHRLKYIDSDLGLQEFGNIRTN